MPIFIVVIRRAMCMICTGQFDIEPSVKPPDKCLICGSPDWEWGPVSRESKLIRQGIARMRKRLNPGAASRARQQQGKRQWRQFKSKEKDKE